MYWPNGVPRVYAVNGPGIQLQEVHDDADSDANKPKEREEQGSSVEHTRATTESSIGSRESWPDEPVTGLCVSRTGHLFATMTKSTIAIWQTRVRCLPTFISGFDILTDS